MPRLLAHPKPLQSGRLKVPLTRQAARVPVCSRPVIHAPRSEPSWLLTRIHLPLAVAACALSGQQQGDLSRGRVASTSLVEYRATRSYILYTHTPNPLGRPPAAIA